MRFCFKIPIPRRPTLTSPDGSLSSLAGEGRIYLSYGHGCGALPVYIGVQFSEQKVLGAGELVQAIVRRALSLGPGVQPCLNLYRDLGQVACFPPVPCEPLFPHLKLGSWAERPQGSHDILSIHTFSFSGTHHPGAKLLRRPQKGLGNVSRFLE